ncbi:hypothetical protein L4D11_03300 [Vibrio gigantis]
MMMTQMLINSASEELEHVLKELRPLIKVLNDKPNALVFGSDVQEAPDSI